MKITVNVNIGGISFVMDDDAYVLLKDYLARVSYSIGAKEDKDEVLSDVERRVSELLIENGVTDLRVVTVSSVKRILAVIGDASIFGDGVNSNKKDNVYTTNKRLMRDSDNMALGGVCSGLAAFIGTDITLIRVLFVFLIAFGGSSVLLYLVAWIIIPKTKSVEEKTMMNNMHNGI